MLRVTADTTIIIPALNFTGNPRRILELAEEGFIELALSDPILNEVARVLGRPKFGWLEEEILGAISQLSRFARHIEPHLRLDIITEDPTDNRILECAVTSGSKYLISGDKHLLKLGRYAALEIVPPADFLQLLAAREPIR